jgi:cholera toxin transcriptional activator
MTEIRPARRYRFGVFEVDSTTGSCAGRACVSSCTRSPPGALHAAGTSGEMLTREEICREQWPDGTFVDYEHGVNSAVNRLRGALGE